MLKRSAKPKNISQISLSQSNMLQSSNPQSSISQDKPSPFFNNLVENLKRSKQEKEKELENQKKKKLAHDKFKKAGNLVKNSLKFMPNDEFYEIPE